jgi:hypothetical protein
LFCFRFKHSLLLIWIALLFQLIPYKLN